jgi:hypothetical protein
MRAFKQYLTESHRTYDFRVRIADTDLTQEVLDSIERGLSQFDLADMSKPKRLPTARTREFTALGPVERHQFEVKLNYPTTSDGVRNAIYQSARIPAAKIIVRTSLEDDLPDHEQTPEQSLVAGKDTFKDDDNAQDHVGDKRVGSLLKDLIANRSQTQQVKNVNDAILAKSAHSEKTAKTTNDATQGNLSPIGSKQNKIPSPVKGR